MRAREAEGNCLLSSDRREPVRGFESLRIRQDSRWTSMNTEACRSGPTALPRKQMVGDEPAPGFDSLRFLQRDGPRPSPLHSAAVTRKAEKPGAQSPEAVGR